MKHETYLDDAALVVEHLAAGVRQRSPLQDIVTSLAQATSDPLERRRLDGLASALASGRSVGEALLGWPGVGMGSLKDWLERAQTGDRLAEALNLLAADLQLRARRRQQLRLALLWPAVLLAIATVVSAIASIFVLPSFRQAFDDLGLTLPEASQAYFWALPGGESFLTTGFVLSFLALVVVLWLVNARSEWPERLYHALRLDHGRWAYETQLRLLPLMLMPDSGVHAEPFLRYLADTTPVPRLRRRLFAVADTLRSATTLGPALQQSALVSQDVVVHLDLARRTDNLGAVGELLGRRLHDRWMLACARFERSLTLIVYAVAAIMAMQLLIALYLPIFKLGQTI